MKLSSKNTKRVSSTYCRTTITKRNCMRLVKALIKLKMWYVIESQKSTVLWRAKTVQDAKNLIELVA